MSKYLSSLEMYPRLADKGPIVTGQYQKPAPPNNLRERSDKMSVKGKQMTRHTVTLTKPAYSADIKEPNLDPAAKTGQKGLGSVGGAS